MRRFNLLLFLSMIGGAANAQFINNGATVTIQAGATLRVETDFTNTSGTITNNGTLEVQGNFTNATGAGATLTPGVGLVKFIGTTASNLDAGGDPLNNVEMAKTANGLTTLTSAAELSGALSFTGAGSKLALGNFNLTMTNTAGSVTATTDHPTNGYVQTSGTGLFEKVITANGTKVLQVGDATNYTPVSCAVTGSAYAAAKVSGRVLAPAVTAKYVGTTDFINREWQVTSTGVTGYANTLTGTYVSADATGTQSLIKGATYHTADWRFDGSNNGALQVIASTTNADVRLSGKNFYGKVNLKAFLQGAYAGGVMSTTLNTNSLIPTTSPYADAPAMVATIPAGVTDWVRLELRDPAAPSTSTTFKTSAFIKSDGTIVGLDGTSLPTIKNGFATSVVVLSHRNHLPIRTVDAGLNVVNPTLHDFSTGLGQAYDNGSVTTNESMKDVSGVFVLWGGNGNSNTTVNYGAVLSDRISLLSNPNTPGLITRGLGNNQGTTITNAYSNNDFNMNGTINYGAVLTDRIFLLSTVLGNDQSKTLNQHL